MCPRSWPPSGSWATYGLGNLTLLAAYRNGGKASIVTPLAGLYPAATIPLAILVFKESLGPRAWVGVALALAAGVALAYESEKELAEVQDLVAQAGGQDKPSATMKDPPP
jgi:drug/metabolite transporter (DMT)-like permease